MISNYICPLTRGLPTRPRRSCRSWFGLQQGWGMQNKKNKNNEKNVSAEGTFAVGIMIG